MNFLTYHITALLAAYKGAYPLAVFLKDYFRQWPKLGARDRKAITEAVFLYYRYAHLFPAGMPEMEVIREDYRRSGSTNVFLHRMLFTGETERESLAGILPHPQSDQHRYFHDLQLSDGLLPEKWFGHLLTQPRFFIRVRSLRDQVFERLRREETDFTVHQSETAGGSVCLSLPGGLSLEKWLSPESYVVQDWASQKSLQWLFEKVPGWPGNEGVRKVWDVCAGAGGKSLYLKDLFPGSRIWSTDLRERILFNLLSRFKAAKLEAPVTAVLDATDEGAVRGCMGERRFNLIVCDVPCSGSGTWARTPEQFYFFRPEHLQRFRELQYPIARNALPYLAKGGVFAYITCSVFYAENEAVTLKLRQHEGLKMHYAGLIDGIPYGADCMYAAIFERVE